MHIKRHPADLVIGRRDRVRPAGHPADPGQPTLETRRARRNDGDVGLGNPLPTRPAGNDTMSEWWRTRRCQMPGARTLPREKSARFALQPIPPGIPSLTASRYRSINSLGRVSTNGIRLVVRRPPIGHGRRCRQLFGDGDPGFPERGCEAFEVARRATAECAKRPRHANGHCVLPPTSSYAASRVPTRNSRSTFTPLQPASDPPPVSPSKTGSGSDTPRRGPT